MVTNSAEDAFPAIAFYNEQPIGCSDGLSKREFFAAMALQGLCASLRWQRQTYTTSYEVAGPSGKVLAVLATEIADDLIKSLNVQ